MSKKNAKPGIPVAKNDIIEMEIHDLGTQGEGIGRYQDYTLFVPGALPGETVQVRVVKVKSHYGFGRLEAVLKPSEDRCEPSCTVAGKCGGCQLQHLLYEAQLKYKENHVRNLLQRVAGLETVPMESIIGQEDWMHYRNKVQYPVREMNGELQIGFYAQHSHRIVESSNCLIQSKRSEEIISFLASFMRFHKISAYNEETGKGLVRHVLIREGYHTGELLVCLIINGEKMPNSAELCYGLQNMGVTTAALNINKEKTNVILGSETRTLFGSGYIYDCIGNLKYRIAPVSFFQVNPVQTEKLYGTALEMADLSGNETVWDAYCGAGTISLFLAQKAKKVYGVEIVPEAIEDAWRNAKDNHVENVDFYVGQAEEVIPHMYAHEGVSADVMVVDPPRAGCDNALLQTMRTMQPERIVYVSCDPGTLARDVKILCEGGLYEVKRVRCVDMFPQTVHVETVVLLSQRRPDAHIDIKLDLSELDITAAETKATYQEIKDYVLEKHGLKVSTLYISQVKTKCGIIERENYNKGKEGHRVPQCPKEKEDAIMDALQHFKMI